MPAIDIVGIKEMAERLGRKPQTAAAWRVRGLLPPEEGTVSGAPAWSWETIQRWARDTGRLGGVAEFVLDGTDAWRVVDGEHVNVLPGVVVSSVSAPFPQPLTDGRIEDHVRFLAAHDRQWYQLSNAAYLRGTGQVQGGDSNVGKVLAAAAGAVGLILLADQAAKQQQGSVPKTSADSGTAQRKPLQRAPRKVE